MEKYNHLRITDLPEDDKPREKLKRLGATSLSDAELIAIIIQTGAKNATSVELGQRVLAAFDGELSAFFDTSIEELSKNKNLKGIGPAKACQIKAAIELGRRVNRGKKEYPQVNNPGDVAEYLMDEMRYYKQEHFSVLLLNTKNCIYKHSDVTVGTVNASLVHPREVFTLAIRQNATSIIVAHNHPSGDPTPSGEDRNITNRLVEVGEIVGIQVLDHLIIGDGDYISFREQGFM